jgi:hypothetical protein
MRCDSVIPLIARTSRFGIRMSNEVRQRPVQRRDKSLTLKIDWPWQPCKAMQGQAPADGSASLKHKIDPSNLPKI